MKIIILILTGYATISALVISSFFIGYRLVRKMDKDTLKITSLGMLILIAMLNIVAIILTILFATQGTS